MIQIPSIRSGRAAVPMLLVLATLLAGCASGLPSLDRLGSVVTPYRVDVIQGNVVTREQAQALQPGMPREQVRDILGTPLLTSVFHADRWDYVFTLQRRGQEPQQRKMAVFFRGDLLERVEADELPSEAEFVASLDVRRRAGRAPMLEASEEQLRRFSEVNRPVTQAVPPAAPPTPRPSPPLEPAEGAR